MLKAGIFLDVENLSRTGGRGFRYETVRRLVEAQGATVLRANAYLSIDVEREDTDESYRLAKENHRNAVRRNGFHLRLKEARRYRNDDGVDVVKANADLDLAVDALLQAENLDYILLGTGDGDFLRLVRALQDKGKRVDVLSFGNVSGDLKREADYHHYGFLIPDLLPPSDFKIGVMHYVDERGFAYLTVREGLSVSDLRTDVILYAQDYTEDGRKVSAERFRDLKTREVLIEFELIEGEGKPRARNATEFNWK